MDGHRFDDLTRRLATTSRRGLLKALIGAAGGGLLALGGSRPTLAAPCRPDGEDCRGCCWEEICVAGNTAERCGLSGAACVTCPEDRPFCVAGECLPCDRRTCQTGCCWSNRCLPGRSEDFCGTGGVECDECGRGESCIGAACLSCADFCRGCCEEVGPIALSHAVCHAGTADDRCGRDGEDCQQCERGMYCWNGQCTHCVLLCPGCCNPAGGCEPGNTASLCGVNGGACVQCGPEQDCVAGECKTRCNTRTCRDGCCLGRYDCVAGTADNACLDSRRGEACVDCTVDGARCQHRACVCDGRSCATGCCQSRRVCRPGDDNALCGTRGQECDICTIEGKACSATERRCVCTPDSCAPGCCDDAGDCQPGASDVACGLDGGACQDCTAVGARCQDGRCVCDRQSCPDGCCRFNRCREGTSSLACGRDGEECTQCLVPTTECLNRECVAPEEAAQDQTAPPCGPGTCEGCCAADGSCDESGAGDTACGTGGSACQDCAAHGGRCDGGQCVCDPQTCLDGCCKGARCEGGATNDACGQPGEECEECDPPRTICRNRMCVPPCTAETCPNGCCDTDGNCQNGTSPDACGPKGGGCKACAAGETCEGGTCVPGGRRTGYQDLPAVIPDVPAGFTVVDAGSGPPVQALAATGVVLPNLTGVVDTYHFSAVHQGDPVAGIPPQALDTFVFHIRTPDDALANYLRLTQETYVGAAPVDGDEGAPPGPYAELRSTGTLPTGAPYGAATGLFLVGNLGFTVTHLIGGDAPPDSALLRQRVLETIDRAAALLTGDTPGHFERFPRLSEEWKGFYLVRDGEPVSESGLPVAVQERFHQQNGRVLDYARHVQQLPAPAAGSLSGGIRLYRDEGEARRDFDMIPSWVAQDSQDFTFNYVASADEPDRKQFVKRVYTGEMTVQEWQLAGSEIVVGEFVSRPFGTDEQITDAYNQAAHSTIYQYMEFVTCSTPSRPCENVAALLRDALLGLAEE